MSEKNEIERDGATAQPNSGRGPHAKGDAVLGDICYDVKEYTESFSVSRKNWAKISLDAFTSGRRMPALKLVLGAKDTKSRVRLWVIGDDLFHEMYECWIEKHGMEA